MQTSKLYSTFLRHATSPAVQSAHLHSVVHGSGDKPRVAGLRQEAHAKDVGLVLRLYAQRLALRVGVAPQHDLQGVQQQGGATASLASRTAKHSEGDLGQRCARRHPSACTKQQPCINQPLQGCNRGSTAQNSTAQHSTAQHTRTLRSSEPEASRLPVSFQHSRLTHPLCPLRQEGTDNMWQAVGVVKQLPWYRPTAACKLCGRRPTKARVGKDQKQDRRGGDQPHRSTASMLSRLAAASLKCSLACTACDDHRAQQGGVPTSARRRG